MLSDKTKQELEKQGVVAVYLFGSAVTGNMHKESDVDIAALLNKTIEPNEYFQKSLDLPPLFSGLFPGREKVVTILNQAPPLLKRDVVRDGQVLFCCNEQQRMEFEATVPPLYEDYKHLSDIAWFYLKKRLLSLGA